MPNKCQSILVTEDNDDSRELLVHFLRHQGYLVSSARNGAEALRRLKEMPGPALILLDLMMPVMDGWEFLSQTHGQSHVVVTLSAVHAMDEDHPPISGVSETLSKPLYMNELRRVLHTYCQRPPEGAAGL